MFDNFGVSTVLNDLTITKNLIEKGVDDKLLTKDYLVALINLSNKCLDTAATRAVGAGNDAWSWFVIPKVCRNCTTTADDCFNKGRYSPIMSTSCNSAPFEIFVGYLVDNSTARGAVFTIRPNCSYSGGIIAVS